MINPQAAMKVMGAFNVFKSNHPKFVNFVGMLMKKGITEGTVIEVTVTRPGEEPVTSNMKVMQSDLDLIESLKDLRG